jgi:hypothetical protein
MKIISSIRIIGAMTLISALAGASPPPGSPDLQKCHQPRYVFRTFDVPSAIYPFSGAFGINNRCQIVGSYAARYAEDGETTLVDGYLFSRGVFTDVSIPDSVYTELLRINDFGVSVGDYIDASDLTGSDPHFFIRRPDGTIHLLPPVMPDAVFEWLWAGINNQGTIVGTFVETNGPLQGLFQGYVLQSGKYEVFNYPGAGMTALNGINDCGTIAGFWVDVQGVGPGLTNNYYNGHGFLRHKDGRLVAIDMPGARDSGTLGATFPLGLNNKGDVVGKYVGSDNNFHGFVLSKGVYTTLDAIGSEGLTQAYDINEEGVIVGTFTGSDGNHGFIAFPARGRD